jgi:transcriptional regulator with GAF, ATPase, and Fis domain
MAFKFGDTVEFRQPSDQPEQPPTADRTRYDLSRIVGASGALKHVLKIVKKVARSNSTVLIRGETGTGKELVAGAIHYGSHRADRAFIKVNSAALQENLLESSSSDTRRAPSPARTGSASAGSSRPTAARCSSTKSAT